MDKATTIYEWDKEMNRWRHPQSPEWVFYSPYIEDDTGCWVIKAFNERTGDHYILSRKYAEDEILPEDEALYAKMDDYFRHNPTVMSWYNAQKGEIWEITLDNGTVDCLVVSDRDFLPLDNEILYRMAYDQKALRHAEIEVIRFSSGRVKEGRPVRSHRADSASSHEQKVADGYAEEEKILTRKYSDNSYSATDYIDFNDEKMPDYDSSSDNTFLK